MRIFHVIISTLVISSCGSVDKSAESRMIFRYNESAGIHSFDPAFAKDQARIWFCNQIYNSLVQLDSNLQVQPSIAKSWNISEDGLHYDFVIRTDIQFHSPLDRVLNIGDIEYSLNRLVDEKTAAPGAWVLSSVNQISILNDSTLHIELSEPNPAFLGLLSMQYCSVLPVESDTIANFFKAPIGTGPFLFQFHKNNVKLVLRKNVHYFESDNGIQLPYIDAVAVSFIPDKQTAFLEFLKGNFDFLSGIDASYKDELLNSEGDLHSKYIGEINFSKEDYLNTEYLGILMDENQDNHALKDVRVRQALNLAFNRDLMMHYLRNNIGTPAHSGFIPKGLSGYQTNIGYDYNPALAKKLLTEAGFTNAEGIPEINLNTTSSYVDLCEYIQHAWQEIGLQVEVNVNPPSTHRQQVSKSQLSIFRGSWIADYADAENYLSLFYSKNHSPNGPNYTHFTNTEFDVLYEKSIRIPELENRIPLYEKMDSIVINQAAIIPLYYDNVMRFSQSNVKGLGSNAMNLLDLKRVVIMTNY
jgi:ABC-type transport system substrate-binding protein